VVTRPDTRPRHLLGASVVSAGLAVITLITVGGSDNRLGAATVVSLALYGVLLAVLFHTSARSLCVANVFGALWAIWFPLRLLVIQADRRGIALHPAVRSASDGELAVVWVLSLLGFAAFVLGVHVARRRGPARARFVPDLRRNTYLVIAVIGLVASWVQVLMHVRSGVMGEAGNFFLLGIAGAAFVDARDRRWSWVVPFLVGAGALIGTVTWFKATALAPVIAWAFGSVLGGVRMSRLRMVVAAVIALAVFATVQGERLTGGANLVSAAHTALFDYDLKTGLPAHQPNPAAAGNNLLGGVMDRTAGADALMVVRAKTPSVIPFQHGKTIWEPTASAVPGAGAVLGIELNQLSLGRYFASRFWSVNPNEDRSAQAITMPGDLYLNFGGVGVALGMLAFGLLVGFVDRAFRSSTAFGAGVLAYVGIHLFSVESNVAYVLVTSAIRLSVVFALLLVVAVPHRRSTTADRDETVGAMPL
jgi:hypothetical protein